MDPAPLFAVRVLTDGSSVLAQVLPFATSIVGVVVGGLVTYGATVGTERRKFNDETRHLALSIATEVRASIDILNKTIKLFQDLDFSFHTDTMAFSKPISDPLPITRAAASKVGRFDPITADLIAKVLVHIASVKQGTQLIRTMFEKGALTADKFAERQAALAPIIADMRQLAEDLVAAIGRQYGTT